MDHLNRKAWFVTSSDPEETGVELVFASDRNKAKIGGLGGVVENYMDARVRRAPHMDEILTGFYRDSQQNPRVVSWAPLQRLAGLRHEEDFFACDNCGLYACGIEGAEPCDTCQRCDSCGCSCSQKEAESHE